MTHTSYTGRFAPSPSGQLHFGSLLAALGSYLQAKAHNGQWLVRIEDLDPPREVPGAADDILRTLEAYGLCWDGEVMYQSQRHDAYRATLDQLDQAGLLYACRCTRKQIQAAGGFYPGTCQSLALPWPGNALRLHTTSPVTHFQDSHFGRIQIPEALAAEDFIVLRKDGLFAYNLAVVVDDIEQGITEVVRGADLIEPTGRQQYLYACLEQSLPGYLHLPLAVTDNGLKLSKQNHAPALPLDSPQPALFQALDFLGQQPPQALLQATTEELLQWAVANWQVEKIPSVQALPLTPRECL